MNLFVVEPSAVLARINVRYINLQTQSFLFIYIQKSSNTKRSLKSQNQLQVFRLQFRRSHPIYMRAKLKTVHSSVDPGGDNMG